MFVQTFYQDGRKNRELLKVFAVPSSEETNFNFKLMFVQTFYQDGRQIKIMNF